MIKWVKGFLINWQFFSIIPVPMEIPMDRDHLSRAVQTFPVFGLLQGFIYAATMYGLLHGTPFSPLAIAFIVWLLMIILPGGIHLDGWIDTNDAYFSYRDRERRLEIMKDPRTGAFGVLAVIILLSTRFLFIYEIVTMSKPWTFVLIAVIPFLSKSLMGMILLTVKAAKNEGLGHLFQQSVAGKSLAIYPLYAVVLLFAIRLEGLFVALLVLGLYFIMLVMYVFLKIKIKKWFGGITGDVLGASVEGTELVLWMSVWLLHYFVTV